MVYILVQEIFPD